MTQNRSNAAVLGALGILSGTIAWALTILADVAGVRLGWDLLGDRISLGRVNPSTPSRGLGGRCRCLIDFPATIPVLCVSVLAACASYVTPIKDAAVLTQLGFLQPGTTTRDEILARLGTPARRYEDGRIASYPVYRTSDGRLSVMASAATMAPGEFSGGESYTLILVFTGDGVLDRQSLVGKHE